MGLGIGAIAGLTAAVGAVGAIGSSVINSNASSSAAKAQTTAAKNSLQLQQQQWDQTQANLSPFISAGSGALGQYGDLIGANGTGPQTTAIQALQGNPLYTAETGAGNQAILANAAATGGLRSGNTNYNLGQFNANTLAQVYQQQIGNLGNLASLGESAAAGAGNLGLGYSQLGTNTYGAIGSAQAGGILGSAGALNSGINNGLSSILGGIGSYGGFGGFGGSGLGSALGVASFSNPGSTSWLTSGSPF